MMGPFLIWSHVRGKGHPLYTPARRLFTELQPRNTERFTPARYNTQLEESALKVTAGLSGEARGNNHMG
jgi:hypothetical protein